MKDECLFCKIIASSIPSYTLYEDDLVKVFLDIEPSTDGDCLLIPKKHLATIDEVDEELFKHMLTVIKKIKKLLYERLNCEGVTLVQNNDYGQEIKHFHIHITPRYKDDFVETKSEGKNISDIESIYNKLK